MGRRRPGRSAGAGPGSVPAQARRLLFSDDLLDRLTEAAGEVVSGCHVPAAILVAHHTKMRAVAVRQADNRVIGSSVESHPGDAEIRADCFAGSIERHEVVLVDS